MKCSVGSSRVGRLQCTTFKTCHGNISFKAQQIIYLSKNVTAKGLHDRVHTVKISDKAHAQCVLDWLNKANVVCRDRAKANAVFGLV